jgi:hypothetical protein
MVFYAMFALGDITSAAKSKIKRSAKTGNQKPRNALTPRNVRQETKHASFASVVLRFTQQELVIWTVLLSLRRKAGNDCFIRRRLYNVC